MIYFSIQLKGYCYYAQFAYMHTPLAIDLNLRCIAIIFILPGKIKKNRRACADYCYHRNASPRTKGMLEKVSLDLLSRSKSITELSGCHV